MLYREMIAVCSEIRTKHINTLWSERRIVECYTGGTYSNHCNYRFSPYRAINTRRLCYTNQSVNAV